jgi:SAM-dependent methyltransferase
MPKNDTRVLMPDQPFNLLRRLPDLCPDRPYTELAAHPVLDRKAGRSLNRFMARDAYIAQYGFVVLTTETIDALGKLCAGKFVLDAGSGTGYLASRLVTRGVDVLASDMGGETMSEYGMRHCYLRDHEGDTRLLLPGEFDVVLLCWPPYGEPFGFDVARTMRSGQVLVVQGEGPHGCTGDNSLFETVQDESCFTPLSDWTHALNEYHLRFEGIHDSWQVWQKR